MKSLRVFLLLLLASTFAEMSQADCSRYETTTYNMWGWAREPLVGSDAAFLSIRRNIDNLLPQKRINKNDLLEAYKNAANYDSKNAALQFRWAYVAYKMAEDEQKSVKRQQLIECVYEAMGQPTNPQSYQYARLRLFIAFQKGPLLNQNLINLSKKVVQKNQMDYDFKFYTTRNLIYSSTFSDRRVVAVQYAHDIQKVFPKRASSYALLGGIYANNFSGTKSSRLADQAIAFYKQYLQLAPANREFRKSVPQIIKSIENERAMFKRRGMLKS